MDWTRTFDEGPGRNKYGLVFVESKTRLLRARVFPEKAADRLVEGLEWPRNFFRRTTRRDLLEVHGDSGTSRAVPGRDQSPNSAIADGYVNSVEAPISVLRCPPGTHCLNLAE